MTWQLIHADCIEAMRGMDEASVDAIVTDPPYSLSFMSKAWDVQVEHRPWAEQALRVLKPGGHLLSFGGTRTYHRLTCALEDAGFEIRDCLAWLYGSGFPKSLDVSKAIDKAAGAAEDVLQDREPTVTNEVYGKGLGVGIIERRPATPDAERWQGWGTALKPAFEPIVLARKPLSGTVAETVLEYGTGALNVDGTRIGFRDDADEAEAKDKNRHADFGSGPRDNHVFGEDNRAREEHGNYDALGRWPANVLLNAEAAAALDEQSGPLQLAGNKTLGTPTREGATSQVPNASKAPVITYSDPGGASRFFYTAKTSRAERENGVVQYLPDKEPESVHPPSGDDRVWDIPGSRSQHRRNHHPTVKPVDLMQWLCRLITPPGGVVLDPFTGSGSTGIAALREGFDFIGIEREAEYVEIARARIIGDAPLFNVEEVIAEANSPQ